VKLQYSIRAVVRSASEW